MVPTVELLQWLFSFISQLGHADIMPNNWNWSSPAWKSYKIHIWNALACTKYLKDVLNRQKGHFFLGCFWFKHILEQFFQAWFSVDFQSEINKFCFALNPDNACRRRRLFPSVVGLFYAVTGRHLVLHSTSDNVLLVFNFGVQILVRIIATSLSIFHSPDTQCSSKLWLSVRPSV